MNNLMNKAIQLAVEAGKIITSNLERITVVTKIKGTANFVTDIDYQIEEYIISNLRKLTPEYGIFSEEGKKNQSLQTIPYWVIDPLDGTTNFIHNYPSVAISLALISKNNIEFGIVYNPVNHEIFHAKKDAGAYLNKNKIFISNNRQMADSIIGFGLPYDRSKSEIIFKIGQNVFSVCQDLKRKGPASLDLAYVACGRLDGYFELDLELWDYAAGQCILSEAGGKITNWNNAILSPTSKKMNVIASNDKIHGELLKVIKG